MSRYVNDIESAYSKIIDRGLDYNQLVALYYILNAMSYTKRLNKYGRLIKYIRYDNVHKYYAPTRKS